MKPKRIIKPGKIDILLFTAKLFVVILLILSGVDSYIKTHLFSPLTLPFIGILMFISSILLRKIPHLFNYPVKITEQNAESNYKIALLVLNITILLFLIVISLLQYKNWF